MLMLHVFIIINIQVLYFTLQWTCSLSLP